MNAMAKHGGETRLSIKYPTKILAANHESLLSFKYLARFDFKLSGLSMSSSESSLSSGLPLPFRETLLVAAAENFCSRDAGRGGEIASPFVGGCKFEELGGTSFSKAPGVLRIFNIWIISMA